MTVRTVLASASLAALAAGLLTLDARAQGPQPDLPHGGQMAMLHGRHVEAVFRRDALRIYLYAPDRTPLDLHGARGHVAVTYKAPSRPPVQADLVYGRSGHGAGYLEAKLDFARVPEGGAEATVRLSHLPGGLHGHFSLPFHLTGVIQYVCPMKDSPPQAHPGRCPHCGMKLQAKTVLYSCPMHPGVRSTDPKARCWICGMRMSPVHGAAGMHPMGHMRGMGHRGR